MGALGFRYSDTESRWDKQGAVAAAACSHSSGRRSSPCICTGGGSPVPELSVRIAQALRAGDRDEALRWQAVFDDCRALRRRSGLTDPAFVKAALVERVPGFPADVRPPLAAADSVQGAEIRNYLRAEILPRIDASRP